MPNPNTDALHAILSDFWGPNLSAWDVAQILASRGVLVASDAVLTDELCAALTADWDAGRFMDRGYQYHPPHDLLPEERARTSKGAALMREKLSGRARGEETT